MGRKSLFGIIIAVLFFCAIILSIETSLSGWQIALGSIIFLFLTLGFTNFRNSFILLAMTLILYLIVYLSIKFNWFGIIPGAVNGIAIGFLMYFGWIVPHKPFSRSEYVKSQESPQ